ncbi:hypothetical protein [Rhizobium sp. P44RR-XXIV]|uniref:hypothetical protein n=1 Tax=Rhizobium sp. P44RR-XXIV TaxID=1921145 RepID=UPI0010AB1F56|nr:hypothetical protein [Rhizobium sp. P44RR-XXIV]TIX90775.1 hypothetical protein BSK43_016125 [Rhizobium sp. P44RR-XXIV]
MRSSLKTLPFERRLFALRGGMLLGLAILAINVTGLVQLSDLKLQLGAMAPGTNQGWITYEFMDDHIVALSLAWTGLCVAAPSLYLVTRRNWRRLVGMLIVISPALLALLIFVLYVTALSNGLRAVTG